VVVCLGQRFEDAEPVRQFHFEKGLRSFAGWWWFATTGCHVGFESWLERDHVMLMDFDRAVTGLSSQPFWLHWRDEAGAARRHAPDFFARRADGTALVIDVRPDGRIAGRDADAFAVTALACAAAGWQFRRVGECDQVRIANVVAVAVPPSSVWRARGHFQETAGGVRAAEAVIRRRRDGRGPAAHAAGGVPPDVAAATDR
jgi:hypothetical protein